MPPLRIDLFVKPDGSITEFDKAQILIGMDVDFLTADEWVKKGAASGTWVDKQASDGTWTTKGSVGGDWVKKQGV